MGNNNNAIVVGVDGSDDAVAAARWAGSLAVRLGAALHLVHAMRPVDEALLVMASAKQADAGEYPSELGSAVLDGAARAVRADAPELAITRTLSRHAPKDALVGLSRHARLVVLASSDVSRAGALLAGSLTLTVAAKSSCPVVAWRGHDLAPTAAPIVVGIDDDGRSDAAVAMAFELADRLGADVVAVHALPPRPEPGAIGISIMIDWDRNESAARQWLSATIAPVAERWPHVAVSYAVGGGAAGRVIRQHCNGAQFVVVGSRGRGNVASALLGSTGLDLLHHSTIPVLVCSAQTGHSEVHNGTAQLEFGTR